MRLLEMARMEKAEFDGVVRAQHVGREKAIQEYETRPPVSNRTASGFGGKGNGKEGRASQEPR
jgi:hypothetical protein